VAQYHIDFAHLELYECWALLVTLLAYPKESDDDVRMECHASLCHVLLKQRANEDEQWCITPQRIKPLYAFRDANQVNRDFRTLERRFRDRMVAARIGIAFLKEVVLGEAPPLPKGVKRLSLNELCQLVLEDSGQSDPENVETRIWRESIPVIHLACAMAVVVDEQERAGQGPVSLNDLSHAQASIERIITYAQQYADMFVKSASLNITPDQLIRITYSK